MKILKAKLRGFIGIKKGMGLDEVELDLSGVSGLIGLAGPNGHGKTTFLEGLSPYRTLASRDGALKHHVFLRDSYKAMTFSYGDDEYETMVKIDCDSDRSEGFIKKNGVPQVDGKVKSYDAYINGLLGTKALFYNSVFCAQNSEKLSDLTTGEFKSLLVEFLRLDRLTGFENVAKQCMGVINGIELQTEQTISVHREKLEGFEAVERDLEAASDAEKAEVTKGAELRKKLDICVGRIERCREEIAARAANVARKADLEKNMATLQEDITQENAAVEAELSVIRADLKGVLDEISGCAEALLIKGLVLGAAEQEKELGITLEGLRTGVQATGEEIARLKDASAETSRNSQAISHELQSLKNDPELQQALLQLERLRGEVAEQEQALRALEFDPREGELDGLIRSCREKMTALEQRDSTCTSSTCSFIVGALQAKKELPVLEGKKKDLQLIKTSKGTGIQERLQQLAKDRELQERAIGSMREKVEGRTTELNGRLEASTGREDGLKIEIQNKIEELQDLQGQILSLGKDLDEVRQLAGRRAEVEVAESKRDDLARRQQELTAKGVKINTAREERVAAKDGQIRELKVKASELALLIDPDLGKKLEAAEDGKAEIEKALSTSEQVLAGSREKAGILRNKLSEKESAEAELKVITGKMGKMAHEKSEWDYLRNACSKNGLQALEIDGVAPLITGYANDLLSGSFGPNFSVKLVTQDPETGKEVLDIVVIREDGSETLLDNLSGGEKVWVLKALRLAMTLVSKEKSGRNFQSFFADEEDGALDGEKAQNFVGLYRGLMGTGNFDSCFYISHNPNVVGMADHRLEFARGGITIV